MATREIVTLSTFDGLVTNRLGNAVFWTSAERTKLINESLRTWNCLTGMWRKRVTITTTANTIFYSLPSTMTFGTRVEYNSVGLDLGSIYDWDQGNPYWMADRSDPVEWAPVGLTMFAIHPADSRGNQGLVVDGVSATPQLSAASDYIDIGQEDFNAILGYIQHIAVFKEGGEEFKGSMDLFKRFMQQAAKHNAKLRATMRYRHIMGVDESEASKPRQVRGSMTAGAR